MKTRHASRFADGVQGNAARRRSPGFCLAAALVLAALLPGLALADGGPGQSGQSPAYGPPPEPPSPSDWDRDDAPRRDTRIGTIDHGKLGRDDDGNVTMQVGPRPKKDQGQSQAGPFYIYPQIGNMPGAYGQQGQSGQPGPSGQQGQSGRPGGQPPGHQGQQPPGQPGQPGQYGPPGQPGQYGQSGQYGQDGQPGQGQRPGGQGQGGQPPQGQSGGPGSQGNPWNQWNQAGQPQGQFQGQTPPAAGNGS
jgi:hypothetical protein